MDLVSNTDLATFLNQVLNTTTNIALVIAIIAIGRRIGAWDAFLADTKHELEKLRVSLAEVRDKVMVLSGEIRSGKR
jgi:hypothetical protein